MGLQSPDLHKMIIAPRPEDNVLRITVELESKKNPAFPKNQNDVMLILCNHE